MKLKKVARNSLDKDYKARSIEALEGTLKKLFGFKKMSDEDRYYLESIIKCKDFKVILTIENLDRLSADVVPLKRYLNTYGECICIFDGKYNFNTLKKLYNRYSTLK